MSATEISVDPLEYPDNYNMLRNEASAFATASGCPLAPATLAKMAVNGDGPEITYFGRRPTYNVGTFKKYLRSRQRRVRSTAELRRALQAEAAA